MQTQSELPYTKTILIEREYDVDTTRTKLHMRAPRHASTTHTRVHRDE